MVFLVFSKVATSLRLYPGVSKGCHVFSNAVRKNIGNLVGCAATGRGMGGRAAIYQSPLAVVGGACCPLPVATDRGEGDGTDGCSHVFSNAVRKNTAHGWRLVGGLRRSVATGRGQHAPLPLPVATGRWQHAPPTTASGSSVDRVSDVFSNAVRKNTVTRWYHGGLNGFRVFPKFRWHEDGVQGLPKVVMFFSTTV